MNERTKNIMYCVFAMAVSFASGAGAVSYIGKADYERAIAERDRLIGEYRDRAGEAVRINGELIARNSRLENGLADIKNITGTAAGTVRAAIGIIAGVKSVLEALEEDGGVGPSRGAGGGIGGGSY